MIAKLVTEGRYSAPYTPDGVYADLRIMVANRKRLIREMTQIKNRFARWFAIYFPEYTDVFGDYEAQSSMLLLKKVCTPEAIVELGAEEPFYKPMLRFAVSHRVVALFIPTAQALHHARFD